MILDFRKKWEKSKSARPSQISEELAVRQQVKVYMEEDANGILFLIVRCGGIKEFAPIRYMPFGQKWLDEMLEDWFRPGRWCKPTKRQLSRLAKRVRKGKSGCITCKRWKNRLELEA